MKKLVKKLIVENYFNAFFSKYPSMKELREGVQIFYEHIPGFHLNGIPALLFFFHDIVEDKKSIRELWESEFALEFAFPDRSWKPSAYQITEYGTHHYTQLQDGVRLTFTKTEDPFSLLYHNRHFAKLLTMEGITIYLQGDEGYSLNVLTDVLFGMVGMPDFSNKTITVRKHGKLIQKITC